ncbi:hypothetical protein EWM64_g6241 [Hericium alpestre]|uniref:Uncharacterized protein n=1 Tax=Hericium alpestre TaxID=135208 RepID=A0A4Y9ZSJ9_9AGAM|nr:hypothetical protein EWM64_g6241 [Hericium alpestre]
MSDEYANTGFKGTLANDTTGDILPKGENAPNSDFATGNYPPPGDCKPRLALTRPRLTLIRVSSDIVRRLQVHRKPTGQDTDKQTGRQPDRPVHERRSSALAAP